LFGIVFFSLLTSCQALNLNDLGKIINPGSNGKTSTVPPETVETDQPFEEQNTEVIETSGPDTAKNANYLDTLEKEVILELNKVCYGFCRGLS
jgi:hypothetical protein